MKDTRVAKRYAGALFALAQREKVLDAVAQDLTLVERFVAEIPYLRAVLLQPLVSQEQKYKVIDDAFSDRITANSLHFLKLLVRKRRENMLEITIAEFRDLLAAQQNLASARVTSAALLSPDQRKRIEQSLGRMTGKTVEVDYTVDMEILGGVVVRLGDKIIDGSVRGRLQRLEQQLLGTRTLGGNS